jgi:hypothetical protein
MRFLKYPLPGDAYALPYAFLADIADAFASCLIRRADISRGFWQLFHVESAKAVFPAFILITAWAV